MSTNLSTPVLLRRIAQLEATVGRLSEDLGGLGAELTASLENSASPP